MDKKEQTTRWGPAEKQTLVQWGWDGAWDSAFLSSRCCQPGPHCGLWGFREPRMQSLHVRAHFTAPASCRGLWAEVSASSAIKNLRLMLSAGSSVTPISITLRTAIYSHPHISLPPFLSFYISQEPLWDDIPTCSCSYRAPLDYTGTLPSKFLIFLYYEPFPDPLAWTPRPVV